MLFFIIFSLLMIFTTCKHTTEPKLESKAELNLTLEDVSCTEAWIMLKPSNIPLPVEVTLYKNNAAAQNNILCYGDTLLYIDSLLPNQTYRFQAIIQLANQSIKSNEIT
ncbi:MAG: glucosyl transferase, partial [Ignavibacterium sp.]